MYINPYTYCFFGRVVLVELIIYKLYFRIFCYQEIASVNEMTLMFWMKGIISYHKREFKDDKPLSLTGFAR